MSNTTLTNCMYTIYIIVPSIYIRCSHYGVNFEYDVGVQESCLIIFDGPTNYHECIPVQETTGDIYSTNILPWGK